eukprot:3573324-Amphidinium_carterae.1
MAREAALKNDSQDHQSLKSHSHIHYKRLESESCICICTLKWLQANAIAARTAITNQQNRVDCLQDH